MEFSMTGSSVNKLDRSWVKTLMYSPIWMYDPLTPSWKLYWSSVNKDKCAHWVTPKRKNWLSINWNENKSANLRCTILFLQFHSKYKEEKHLNFWHSFLRLQLTTATEGRPKLLRINRLHMIKYILVTSISRYSFHFIIICVIQGSSIVRHLSILSEK